MTAAADEPIRSPSTETDLWVVAEFFDGNLWWIYGPWESYNRAKEWAMANMVDFSIQRLYMPEDPGGDHPEPPRPSHIHPDQARVEDYVSNDVVG